MPQPLSTFIDRDSKCESHFDPDCMSHNAELAQFVAAIIARWANIEFALARLLVQMLGANAKPGYAMFAALTSAPAQIAAIKAAADAILEPNDLETFRAVMAVTRSLRNERNKFAHWIWGYTTKVPDALLIANPITLTKKSISMAEYKPTCNDDRDEVLATFTYDLSKIYVYRKPDFERFEADLKQLQKIIDLTELLFQRRHSAFPIAPSPSEIHGVLSNQQLYSEALSRIRKRQKNNPQDPK